MDQTAKQGVTVLLCICIGCVLGLLLYFIGSEQFNILTVVTSIFILGISFVIGLYVMRLKKISVGKR